MSSVRTVRVRLTRYEPGLGIQVTNQDPIGHAFYGGWGQMCPPPCQKRLPLPKSPPVAHLAAFFDCDNGVNDCLTALI